MAWIRIGAALTTVTLVGLFLGGSALAWYDDEFPTGAATHTNGGMELRTGCSECIPANFSMVYPGWSGDQVITLRSDGASDGILTLAFKNIVDQPYAGDSLPAGEGGLREGLGKHIHFRTMVNGVQVGEEMTINDARGMMIPLGEMCDIFSNDGPTTVVLEYCIYGDRTGNEIQGAHLSFDILLSPGPL